MSKKQKNKTNLIKIILLLVVGIFLAIFSISKSDAQQKKELEQAKKSLNNEINKEISKYTEEKRDKNKETEKNNEYNKIELNKNRVMELENSKVELINVKELKQFNKQGISINTSGKYLEVTLKISNNANHSKRYISDELKLKSNGSNSGTYNVSSDDKIKNIYDNYLTTLDINPNIEKEVVIIYEVPKDLEKYELEYRLDLGSRGYAVNRMELRTDAK